MAPRVQVTPHVREMTDQAPGLATDGAKALGRYGPNELPVARPVPIWRRFLQQSKSPLICVLLFAVAFDVIVWFYDR